MGAAADSGPLLQPFGIGLVLLSAWILAVAALAYCADYLRHSGEARWFIDKPHAQQEGYLLLDQEMKIHAVNERARQWLGGRCVVGMTLDQVGDGQVGWSALDRQLRNVSSGVERLSGQRLAALAAQEFRLQWVVCGIAMTMVGKFMSVARPDGALLLNLKPLAQDQGPSTQPTPLEF